LVLLLLEILFGNEFTLTGACQCFVHNLELDQWEIAPRYFDQSDLSASQGQQILVK
jgi:hypothetical protein